MARTAHNQSATQSESALNRVQRIHDELYPKLVELSRGFGWAVPKANLIISEKVNGVFQTDQSYPWNHPDWSAIAVHPRFAAHKNEQLLRLAIAEAMVRGALKIDATLGIRHGGPLQVVPEDIQNEVITNKDYRNHPWAASKQLPLALLMALSDPGIVVSDALALQQSMARQLINGDQARTPIWKLHKEMQKTLDRDPRLSPLKRFARSIVRIFWNVRPTHSAAEVRLDRGMTTPFRRTVFGKISPKTHDEVFADQRPEFGRRERVAQSDPTPATPARPAGDFREPTLGQLEALAGQETVFNAPTITLPSDSHSNDVTVGL